MFDAIQSALARVGIGKAWEQAEFNQDDRPLNSFGQMTREGDSPRINYGFPKIRRKLDSEGNVTRAQVWHLGTQQWIELTDPNYGSSEWRDKQVRCENPLSSATLPDSGQPKKGAA